MISLQMMSLKPGCAAEERHQKGIKAPKTCICTPSLILFNALQWSHQLKYVCWYAGEADFCAIQQKFTTVKNSDYLLSLWSKSYIFLSKNAQMGQFSINSIGLEKLTLIFVWNHQQGTCYNGTLHKKENLDNFFHTHIFWMI